MRTTTPLLLLTLLTACGTSLSTQRTGQDFADVFRQPRELLDADDPAATRLEIANMRLPDTAEHHAALLAAVHDCTAVDPPHLALLLEAVSMPEPTTIIIQNDVRHAWAPRGKGTFAHVRDELIDAALPKLVGVDRRGFGDLLAFTQSDATLTHLADRFLAAVDDGSTAALAEILGAMHGSPATLPFLTGYLAPRGGLDGDRCWEVMPKLAFDNERTAVIQAVAERHDDIAPQHVLATMKAMSFDDGRSQALDALVGRMQVAGADTAHDIVGTYAFDDGRRRAVEALAGRRALQADHRTLLDLASLCSFDDGRVACIAALAPLVAAAPDARTAARLLETLSFDDARIRVVRIMQASWRQLDPADRPLLLATFSFDSSREQAAALLE